MLRIIWMLELAATFAGCTHEVAPVGQFTGLPGDIATAIAWSRDGRVIAAACGDTVCAWDVQTRRELARTTGYFRHGYDYDATGLDFLPNGTVLAFGGSDGAVHLWSFRDGAKRLLTGQPRTLRVCQFCDDGRTLVTASGGFLYPPAPGSTTAPVSRISEHADPHVEPMTVIVFDTVSGEIRSKLDMTGMLNIAFSANATQFAGIRLDVPPSATLPVHLYDPAMRAVSGSARVELRQTFSGELVKTFPATGFLEMFSADGKLWAGRQIWDTRTFKLVREVSPGPTTFVDGGRRILELNPKSGPGLWPVVTLSPVWHISYLDLNTGWRQHVGDFKAAGFSTALENRHGYSPDRRWVIDRQMRLWRVP